MKWKGNTDETEELTKRWRNCYLLRKNHRGTRSNTPSSYLVTDNTLCDSNTQCHWQSKLFREKGNIIIDKTTDSFTMISLFYQDYLKLQGCYYTDITVVTNLYYLRDNRLSKLL